MGFGSKGRAGSTARAADRCRSMTGHDAQKKAAHYRDLARLMIDEQTKEGLLARRPVRLNQLAPPRSPRPIGPRKDRHRGRRRR
jgi:hypothetical protein